MKNFLLFLALLLGVGSCAFAQEQSYTIMFTDNLKDGSTAMTTGTAISTVVDAGAEYLAGITSTARAFHKSKMGIKFGNSSKSGNVTFALTSEGQVNATKIVIEAARYSSDNSSLSVNGSPAQSITNTSLTDYTYEFDGSQLTEIALTGSGKRFYVKTVTVYYNAGSSVVETVATPEISFDQATGMVSIACATEGASISYTLDGGSETVYSAPFTVEYGSHTVTAKAVKAEMNDSEVASKVFEYKDNTSVGPQASYKIVFVSNPDAVDGKTLNITLPVTSYVEEGAEYISKIVAPSSAYYASLNGLKFGTAKADGSVVFNLSSPVNATKIEVEAYQYKTNTDGGIAVNGSESQTVIDANGSVYAFDLDGAELSSITIKSTKRVYVKSLTVYYSADGEAVATPEISFDGTKGEVSVSCSTEGALIFYTLDGGAETEYSAPFSVGYGNHVVTAKATKDGMNDSKVVTEEFKYVDPDVKMTIAAFVAEKPAEATKVSGPLTVAYRNGRYMFITDGQDWLTSYGDANGAAMAGDILADITGSYAEYPAGTEGYQMAPAAIGKISKGSVPAPAEITLAGVADAPLYSYVKLAGVNISTADKTLSDGTNTVAYYNPFTNSQYYDVVTVEDGENFTVEGFVSVGFNGRQIIPVKIEGGEVTLDIENLAVTVDGSTVTISCDTENVNITYTVNGGDSNVYTGPFDLEGYGAFTIVATASKEGYHTATATADVIINDPSSPVTSGIAMFDFVNEDYGMTRRPSGYNEDGLQIVNQSVTLTSNKNGGNGTRLWDDGLRFYSEAYIVVSGPENSKITDIEMTTTGDSAFAITEEVEGDNMQRSWTGEAKAVRISYTPTSSNKAIKTLKVTYEVSTAIEDVVADAENAPAEYYNLQGVRVAYPAAGQIYIQRQGNKVVKVRF